MVLLEQSIRQKDQLSLQATVPAVADLTLTPGQLTEYPDQGRQSGLLLFLQEMVNLWEKGLP
jgi:hypothetical protein